MALLVLPMMASLCLYILCVEFNTQPLTLEVKTIIYYVLSTDIDTYRTFCQVLICAATVVVQSGDLLKK